MVFDDDHIFVARVLSGDKASFSVLIERHHSAAIAFATRMLSRSEAEDVVQDALLSAFLGLRQLRRAESFKPWLLGIVANLCRTRLRQHRELHFDDRWGGSAVGGFSIEDAQPSAEIVHETRHLHSLVYAAIDALPGAQQDAVRMHYLEDLKISEIAILTGSPVGTIKARLHLARAKLRCALASQIDQMPLEATRGELTMIEVIAHDVILRAPKHEEAKWLPYGLDDKLGLFRVILLKQTEGNRILPIWVGPLEGHAIAAVIEKLPFQRPSTFHLTTALMEAGGMKLDKVAVTSLRDNVFYATMWVNAGGVQHEVDARPSDAITLALIQNAPMFVTEETFERAAPHVLVVDHELSGLEEFHQKALAEGKLEPESTEMAWRSYRSLSRAQ